MTEGRRRVVLIGERIAHSRSPELQRGLAERHGVQLDYTLRPTTPDTLSRAIAELRDGRHLGANVTTPYKEEVCRLLDRLTPESARLGAVNTIIVESDGTLTGANSDIAGVRHMLADEPILRRRFSGAVLGTGGAARAAVEALLSLPTIDQITIYSRSAERAEETIGRWSDRRVVAGLLENYQPVDITVHATPVGMTDDEAVLDVDQLRGTNLLVEMIYSPPVTELMRRARSAGVRAIGGIGMLIGQAEESFRLWTGG